MEQKYTSKDTSINVVNKVYTSFEFSNNSLILDYGGGRFDSNINYMKEKNGSVVKVYDKFNRSKEHNEKVLSFFKNNLPNYIVCSNVLNVIMEDEIIDLICSDILNYSGKDTTIIFVIYEGDRSSIGKITSKGYQRNEKTKEYLSFIEKKFDVIKKKSNMIVCKAREDVK